LDKIPNHINGAYFKHFFVGKFLKTGFELPQYLLNKDDKKVLADKLLGENFCLLGWDVNPEDYLDTKTLARWKSMAGKKATFTAKANGAQVASSLVNESQEYKRLFEAGKKVLVVRPDKMMVINCSLKSLNSKLNKYMDRVGCTI